MNKIVLCLALLILCIQSAQSSLSVSFSGDTVIIRDAGISWSCSGMFFSRVHLSNDTVYITECDTMQLATCLCYYDYSTKLSGLTSGTYTALVTRRHESHVNHPIDTVFSFTEPAGSLSFTITSQPSAHLYTSGMQSACHGSQDVIAEEKHHPEGYLLLMNYPNPFNPTTTIYYTLAASGYVQMTVYTMLGQQAAMLVREVKQAGSYQAVFHADNLPSGIYVCCLETGSRTLSHKMLLLR
jgi:hypothetical protein